jgi:thiamine-phosphate pyrophosphorylase
MKHRLLTTPYFFVDEAKLLNQLFAAGLPLLHLRKPEGTQKEVEALLGKIEPDYYNQIILHQFPVLVKTFGLGGVHLRERARRALEQTNQLNTFRAEFENYILGTAIHQVEDLQKLPHYMDYAFVSPVFDSISKIAYRASSEWKYNHWDSLPFDIVGLGGMNKNTIPIASDRNFKEVAILGAVWEDKNQVIENYNTICQTINGLKP